MPTSRDQKCALLRKNLCFENFFETLCVDRDQTAAIWLENDREQSYNYEEFHARALQTAARIDDARLGRRDGWVGLCLETCVDWPILFWGLLAAGRKPLLLDPTLSDAGLTHLLSQAGAGAVIIGKRRDALPEIAQRLPGELTSGAYSKDFKPCWADRIALCTSGTTATSRVYVYDGRAICLQAIAFIEQQRGRCMTNEKYGRERTLCFLPLNHIFGLMTNMIPTALEGNPQVICMTARRKPS